MNKYLSDHHRGFNSLFGVINQNKETVVIPFPEHLNIFLVPNIFNCQFAHLPLLHESIEAAVELRSERFSKFNTPTRNKKPFSFA